MAGVRDFRQETIEYIRRNLVDDNPDWDAFYDFFRNHFSFNKNLEDDLSNFDKYMARVCEINDITASKLDRIIEDVYSVENSNDAKLNDKLSGLRQCRSLLEKLDSEIDSENFEINFDKNVIYAHWNQVGKLEELRRGLEGMSLEDLMNMDVDNLSEAEQDVYTEVLMRRIMDSDEIDQPELMNRLEKLGTLSDLKNRIYIGMILNEYLLNPTPEQAEMIAEMIASSYATFSDEETLVEIPFLIPYGTAKFSIGASLKTDSPNAVVDFQTSLRDKMLKISTAVGESKIMAEGSAEGINFGVEVGGVSTKVNVGLMAAGIIQMTWSSEASTDNCGVSTSLEMTTSMNRPQPQLSPAMSPVTVNPAAVENFIKDNGVIIVVGAAAAGYTVSIFATGGLTGLAAPEVYGALGGTLALAH